MRIRRDRAADPVQIMITINPDIDAGLSGTPAPSPPAYDTDEDRLAISEDKRAAAVALATVLSRRARAKHEIRDVAPILGDTLAIERLKVRLEQCSAKARVLALRRSSPPRHGHGGTGSDRSVARVSAIQPNASDIGDLAPVREFVCHEVNERDVVKMVLCIIAAMHHHSVDSVGDP